MHTYLFYSILLGGVCWLYLEHQVPLPILDIIHLSIWIITSCPICIVWEVLLAIACWFSTSWGTYIFVTHAYIFILFYIILVFAPCCRWDVKHNQPTNLHNTNILGSTVIILSHWKFWTFYTICFFFKTMMMDLLYYIFFHDDVDRPFTLFFFHNDDDGPLTLYFFHNDDDGPFTLYLFS